MLPAESHKWQAVENAARRIAALYNAQQIRTPVFESADLFLRSVGEGSDIVNKEMYIFEDKGGRKMALRPEGTAGVMRSFIENNLGESLPLKTYYIESIYRYEQPQSGRYREHHQFGTEFFGSEAPEFDAEVIALANDCLHEVGFGDDSLRLEINSIGCAECRAEYNKALKAFLASHINELCTDCKRRAAVNPLRALDCKVEECKRIYKDAPRISDYLCDDCKAHMSAVKSSLDLHGITYSENDKLVRGLDYYTRTVFEFIGPKYTVLGGGRYDGLCEQLGGKHMPCVGFGCGIERLIEAAEGIGVSFNRPLPQVFVAAQCSEAKTECARIVRSLRKAGISAESDLMGKSLKAQFKYADRRGFIFVITIGESELNSQQINIKRMTDGSVFSVDKSKLPEQVGRLLCQK